MRSFISRAALLVKVTHSIWPGQARRVARIWARRVVSTLVLPVPRAGQHQHRAIDAFHRLALFLVQAGEIWGIARNGGGFWLIAKSGVQRIGIRMAHESGHSKRRGGKVLFLFSCGAAGGAAKGAMATIFSISSGRGFRAPITSLSAPATAGY